MNSLNYEQNRVLVNFKMNKNILVTGPAGTGKSFLINQLKKSAKIINKKIAVTAMTGCAAWNIKGKTLHSWSGIGIGDKPVENLIKTIKKKSRLREKWINTDVLIIDEISMLTKDLFEKLNEIAKIIRLNQRPFGGLQIILLGDFYQLPPIDINNKVSFCFESPIWDLCIHEKIILKDIIRQIDPKLQKCLNEIREGKCSDETETIFLNCLDKKIPSSKEDIIPTKIFSMKTKIKEINDRELNSLNNEIIEFNLETKTELKKKDYIISDNTHIDYYSNNIDKNANYEKNLQLAIGAQVMLLVNLDTDNGLINGSRGIVIDFRKIDEKDIKKYPVVKFLDGQEQIINPYTWEFDENDFKMTKKQIPLQLAWAITIHKIQGSTLNFAIIDAGSSIFEYGQSYVALSRVTSLEGLYLLSFSKKKIKAHPKVIEFYKKLIDNKEDNIKRNIFDHFKI